MTSKKDMPRIIVGGFLGLLPAGGVVWDYVQYPVGLSNLGCDVYYIEDTGLWPIYHKDKNNKSNSSGNPSLYLASAMEAFGMENRWAYLDVASGYCYGLSERKVKELCRSTDIFINISFNAPLIYKNKNKSQAFFSYFL